MIRRHSLANARSISGSFVCLFVIFLILFSVLNCDCCPSFSLRCRRLWYLFFFFFCFEIIQNERTIVVDKYHGVDRAEYDAVAHSANAHRDSRCRRRYCSIPYVSFFFFVFLVFLKTIFHSFIITAEQTTTQQHVGTLRSMLNRFDTHARR